MFADFPLISLMIPKDLLFLGDRLSSVSFNVTEEPRIEAP